MPDVAVGAAQPLLRHLLLLPVASQPWPAAPSLPAPHAQPLRACARAPHPPRPPAPQADLTRARESFVLTTELHLTYLCVPITDTVAFLDWKKFHAMLGTLNVGLGSRAVCRACLLQWRLCVLLLPASCPLLAAA